MGDCVGIRVGCVVGDAVGNLVGTRVGVKVGNAVGASEGAGVGVAVGLVVGAAVIFSHLWALCGGTCGELSKQPVLQPHMYADAQGGVGLRQFDETAAGMVESFVARFPAEDPELLALWRAEAEAVAD